MEQIKETHTLPSRLPVKDNGSSTEKQVFANGNDSLASSLETKLSPRKDETRSSEKPLDHVVSKSIVINNDDSISDNEQCPISVTDGSKVFEIERSISEDVMCSDFVEKVMIDPGSVENNYRDSLKLEKRKSEEKGGKETEDCKTIMRVQSNEKLSSDRTCEDKGREEECKKTVRVQSNEKLSSDHVNNVKSSSLKACPSLGANLEIHDQVTPSPGIKSMMDEAWERLKKAYVYFKGKPVGTLAAIDPSAEALNYNQV